MLGVTTVNFINKKRNSSKSRHKLSLTSKYLSEVVVTWPNRNTTFTKYSQVYGGACCGLAVALELQDHVMAVCIEL